MSIEKSIELYEIMIKNLEKSGFGDEQVQVYKEIIEFTKDCPTAIEANKKLKSSKYYLAPTIALMKDRFETFKKANLAIEMEEIAKVYDDKIKEIETNPNTTYETGYEQKANGLWAKHEDKLYAFSNIYKSYITFLASDDEDYQLAHKDLVNTFQNLISVNGDFLELSNDKKFRDILPINDKDYNDFIKNTPIYIKSPPDFNQVDDKEINRVYEKLKENKSKLEEIGKNYLNKVKASGAISTSPNDENGKYNYIDISEVDL